MLCGVHVALLRGRTGLGATRNKLQHDKFTTTESQTFWECNRWHKESL